MSSSSETVVKVQPEELRKGGFAMIRGMPCRLTAVDQVRQATANGNKKLKLTGLHIFTSKKYEDTINLTAGFHGIDAPVTTKATYTLLDVDASTGDLSLLIDSGETKEDVSLVRAEDGSFDEIGQEVARRFEQGEALQLTVLHIMDRDLVTEARTDTDS
jgi:translation initiation factor 5A